MQMILNHFFHYNVLCHWYAAVAQSRSLVQMEYCSSCDFLLVLWDVLAPQIGENKSQQSFGRGEVCLL